MINRKILLIILGLCCVCCTFMMIWISWLIWLNMPYMTGDDPKNPLNYSGLEITNEVKWVSDQIVRREDSSHEKTIEIMHYIDQNILVERTTYYSLPNNVIHERKGLCGNFGILAVGLLTTQNIPSHVIAMCENQGKYAGQTHVAIEVYYNNSWHYYDTTFSAYWIRNGTVLSFEDLKNGGAKTAQLYVGNITRYNLYEGGPLYLTSDYYENSSPSGVVTKECPLNVNCSPAAVSKYVC